MLRQVAAHLGVCRATVYELVENGELAHVRISNAIRVAPADLDAFIASRRWNSGKPAKDGNDGGVKRQR